MFAGVSSKSNVTRGVPRIEELLSLTENIKNPSITIQLKENTRTDYNSVLQIKDELEYTTIGDITDSVSICYNNEKLKENVYKEYDEFIVNNSKDDDDEEKEEEKDEEDEERRCIGLILELNKKLIFEKNIQIEDIEYAINEISKFNITVPKILKVKK